MALMPDVGLIMAYEQGELEEHEVIGLFQSLIDSGLAWQLQGAYGRQAMRLIEAGLCHPAQES
jgi:hypothetical protein